MSSPSCDVGDVSHWEMVKVVQTHLLAWAEGYSGWMKQLFEV